MRRMKTILKRLINSMLVHFDIEITRHSEIEKLRSYENDFTSLLQLPKDTFAQLVSLTEDSKSQLHQDLFVLAELGFKRGGYFVEFGATNGVDLSNSYLLEKKFGWNGILAEPARCWHSALQVNRASHIETRCVFGDSVSVLSFNEVEAPELSTIAAFSDSDCHEAARKYGRTYDVQTISLNDLLDKYNAPKVIDYLSIDTEGSEYEILCNFDFSKYQFSVITCEHNFTPMREKIFKLLTANGYSRKYLGFSKWDDWYVKNR